MNKALRNVATAVMVLIVALLANLTWIQVVQAPSLRADQYNSRSTLDEYSRQRGQITTVGGFVLARSEASDDAWRYQRVYPGGEMYGALTGYYSTLYGATGIEKSQNEILAGNSDELLGSQFGDLITGRDPRGGNVQLTVVPAVQEAAFNALKNNGYVGAVVALQPKTGEVLAMATTPTYDPTPLASHDEAVQRQLSDLINSAQPSPRINRAISEVYPPGSTFKVIDTAAAFQNGFGPDSEVTGAASIELPNTNGTQLANYGGNSCAGAGGADVTFTQAFAASCNTAFAEVMMQVGADPLRAQADRFGVDGQGFSVGLDVTASRLGDIPDQGALAQTSIGQRDVAFTVMQNAMVAATVANGGDRMAPYLVARTTRPDLSVITTTEPTVAEQGAVPPEVNAQLQELMVASESQTAGHGSVAGVTIASKTGTAEHGEDPKNTPPHAWYIAYAPAENPTVAVAVFVDSSGGNLDGTGGSIAAPIGRTVIAAALAGQ